nr:reverse transcriptase domain-containing protein [Tanacetum cinerariifolium]
MAKKDKEKTGFYNSHEVYCYTKMPSGLKNAGTTYQRLVDKAFDRQVGQNLEIYVDDLVIKSHTETELLQDIEETFRTLRKINMKLNPKKCTFGAAEGMFLGYMINPEGIKPCPDKTEAVLQLPSLRTIKEIQSLNGKLASLNRFISKSVEKSLPLFKTLKKTISAVFMTEKDTVQTAVHFVSQALQAPELNYTSMEKLVLTLVCAGMILTSLEGTEFTYALRFQFTASNNEAEYEALIDGLRIVTQMGVRNVHAKVVATIAGNQVKKFVWDNIVFRFGLPGEIVSDNGKQFNDNPFKDWCEKLNITQRFASVKHPQSNGLVKRANRSLGKRIKARLGEENKNWIEELPHVCWAHHTMIKSSHSDTPFSLTYGTKAVIPAEIKMPTYRTTVVDAVHNNEELRLNLDLLEERRECAAIREAKAKLKMTKYYNTRVRGVTFRPRDFVYRSNEASYAMDGEKLDPKWEGPYEVTEALGDGAYRLRSMDGVVLLRTWNVANLKKCYL